MVDNLLQVNRGTLKESQSVSRTTSRYTLLYCIVYVCNYCYRILESIDTVVSGLPLINLDEPVSIAFNMFVVSIISVQRDEFNGLIFSANVNVTNATIGEEFGYGSTNQSTVAISLPHNLLNSYDNSNRTRITNIIFLDDKLFLRRSSDSLEVNSVVISATVVNETFEDLLDPVNISFVQEQVILIVVGVRSFLYLLGRQ